MVIDLLLLVLPFLGIGWAFRTRVVWLLPALLAALFMLYDRFLLPGADVAPATVVGIAIGQYAGLILGRIADRIRPGPGLSGLPRPGRPAGQPDFDRSAETQVVSAASSSPDDILNDNGHPSTRSLKSDDKSRAKKRSRRERRGSRRRQR